MKNEDKKDYEMLAFILSGSTRIRVYCFLLKEPRSYAYEIVKKRKLNISSVRRVLRDLKEAKVIECINPDSKRRKFFELTKEALRLKEEVLKRI